MTLPRIKENVEFKNKMPVNFLTDWHYSNEAFFNAARSLHFLFFNIQGINRQHRLRAVLHAQLAENRRDMRFNRGF